MEYFISIQTLNTHNFWLFKLSDIYTLYMMVKRCSKQKRKAFIKKDINKKKTNKSIGNSK